MTPEELNRTIEFLVQHQAQFSIYLDQFGQRMDEFGQRMDQLGQRMEQLTVRVDDLAALQKQAALRQERDIEWAKGLFSRITELVEFQSRRLTLQERILQENEEAHRQFREERLSDAEDANKRHEEVVARLDQIVEKLTDRRN